jgi:hypothetical protein
MTTRRKYRRCSECGSIRPARDFRRVGSPGVMTHQWTACPECGHVGLWSSFEEIDPPAEGEIAP